MTTTENKKELLSSEFEIGMSYALFGQSISDMRSSLTADCGELLPEQWALLEAGYACGVADLEAYRQDMAAMEDDCVEVENDPEVIPW